MNARIEELFDRVADLTSDARTQYFAEHGVDEETRQEVEALLRSLTPARVRSCSVTLVLLPAGRSRSSTPAVGAVGHTGCWM